MSRSQIMRVAAVNIKTQPHTPAGYIKLFKTVYELEKPGKIRGFDWGMIGSVHEDDDFDDTMVIYGRFFRFMNIDPEAAWLDTKKLEPIDAKDSKKFIIIPDNLKPNLRIIPYIFFPNIHRLFFDCRYLSTGSMLHLLKVFFEQEKVFKEVGNVDIIIESTKEAIEKIISIPRLMKLEIVYTRPNGDDLGSLAQRFHDRMENQGIRKLEETATALDKDGIKADAETIALMNVARSEGKVSAKGYDKEDKKISVSTENHPLVEQIRYQKDRENEINVLYMAAKILISKIAGLKQ